METTERGFHLFATPVGLCGVAWGPGGILALGLPEASETALRGRLARRAPGAREMAPPAPVAAARDGVLDLLGGTRRTLAEIALDMTGIGDFERAVYAAAREIPPGEVVTYGELAGRVGDRRQARAVGQALGRNPFVIVVPCHRIMAAQGGTGGFSAHGGVATKMRLLEIEGARLPGADAGSQLSLL